MNSKKYNYFGLCEIDRNIASKTDRQREKQTHTDTDTHSHTQDLAMDGLETFSALLVTSNLIGLNPDLGAL